MAEHLVAAATNSPLDWVNVIGTWALFVGAFIAIRVESGNTTRTIKSQVEIGNQAIAAQAAATTRLLSADVFARLNDKWDSPSMRKRRQVLSAELLKARRGRRLPPDSMIADVIDFFEDLGLLVRKEWLDPEAAWHSFAECARMYWEAVGRNYALSVRRRYEGDDTYYTEYEFLVVKLDQIEIEKRSLESQVDIAIDPDSVKTFLDSESNLRTSDQG